MMNLKLQLILNLYLGKELQRNYYLTLHLKRLQSNPAEDWFGKMDLISVQITFGKLPKKKIIQPDFTYSYLYFATSTSLASSAPSAS